MVKMERRKGYIMGMVLIMSIFSALVIYSFWYDTVLQIPTSVVPLFINDFSGKTSDKLTEIGNWYIKEGKYVTTGGISSFGSSKWEDYIIEINMSVISGKDISIELRCREYNNCYRVQADNNYDNVVLYKINNEKYIGLDNTKIFNVGPNGWHIWKIAANGNNIQVFVDNNQLINYTDIGKPYLNGNIHLRTVGTVVEYDYVYVYEFISNRPIYIDDNISYFTYLITVRDHIMKLTYILMILYIASLIVFNTGEKVPILTGLIFLIIASITVETKEMFSGNMAIYGYYFLIIGVSIQVVSHIREERKKGND